MSALKNLLTSQWIVSATAGLTGMVGSRRTVVIGVVGVAGLLAGAFVTGEALFGSSAGNDLTSGDPQRVLCALARADGTRTAVAVSGMIAKATVAFRLILVNNSLVTRKC